jgi:hypothetical protein
MYEKQINELEIMIGRYRYLEDLGNKYKTKFANISGNYKFEMDPCLYNISTPELDIRIKRTKPNGNIVFLVAALIHYVHDTKQFKYEIHLYNGKDKNFTYPSEISQMMDFEKMFTDELKKFAKDIQRKTLKAINSLAG